MLKFCRGKYVMTKSEREKIENRVDAFVNCTGTNSSIRVTLITCDGVLKNANSYIVQNQITLEDFFV